MFLKVAVLKDFRKTQGKLGWVIGPIVVVPVHATMWWSLKIFNNWILSDGIFSLRYTSSNENSLPVYPPLNLLLHTLS